MIPEIAVSADKGNPPSYQVKFIPAVVHHSKFGGECLSWVDAVEKVPNCPAPWPLASQRSLGGKLSSTAIRATSP
jgi:hypothetical protein